MDELVAGALGFEGGFLLRGEGLGQFALAEFSQDGFIGLFGADPKGDFVEVYRSSEGAHSSG